MTAIRGALIGGALLLATAASGFAQTGPTGPYVRLEGGLSVPGDITVRSSTGASASIDRDLGFIGGIAGGYQFGPFRAELDADYSQNDVSSIKSGAASVGLRGNTANLSVMVNGLYDINLGMPIVPYIGAGIGTTDYRANNIRSTTGATVLTGDRWGFAVQPIVGVSYSITPQISVAGEYRYLYGVDEVHAGTATFTNREHHFLLSATWHFGSPAAPPPAPVAAPPAPPPAAVAPQKQVFIVFFEFDKSALTADGRKVVDAAASAFKSGKSGIAIAGYTDLAGTQQYNLALSKRRADTVKAALVRDGVPTSAIDESWHGKENPRVPTADGVREPQNRRVEITM
ncbi:MAG TPA: OmpA family protein [Stellaceae bacterium]|jgi:outer membrane protein OmpA-like peptidoglycan-associated protein